MGFLDKVFGKKEQKEEDVDSKLESVSNNQKINTDNSNIKTEVTVEDVKTISNQNTLKDIALNNKDMLVRGEAVRKLNDEDVLKNIALNDETYWVKQEAIVKIEDT